MQHGCPDTWLNTILGVHGRMFLDGSNTGGGKAEFPPQCRWVSSKSAEGLKGTKAEEGEFNLSALQSWREWGVHLCRNLQTGSPASRTFVLGLEPYYYL